MALIAPVTRGVSDALRACVGPDGLTGVHPGLVLDKFAKSWDDTGDTKGLSERVQRPTIDQVVRLSANPLPELHFEALAKRWEALTASALAFEGTTAGPLTLHLARASALENAGICLHPIYGFTYLPGSGLKGLARSFAETVARASADDVRAVFGHVGETSAAGAVVFHDAWPRAWPKLTCDILNSHHAEYYSKGAPPGDWEDPVPVYFLSVPAGVAFRFALAKRRDDVPTELLERAADWLAGGLTVLGCGAKTATGYGHFHKLTRTPAAVASPARAKFATQLELVTPAFLAGAQQAQEDCDLRPATLRGQLRWWWRTLHSGFVTVRDLQRMEAAVWGDTTRGGAVRTTVAPTGDVAPVAFDRNEVIRANRLPPPPDRKTTQGLTYHSYGTDEKKGRRFYLAPGTKWAAELTARPARLVGANPKEPPRELPAEIVLAQAKAALALLCRFGGVGAKCRKGFGSFIATGLPTFDLDALKREAAAFRTACDVGVPQFRDELATSPALGQMLPLVELPTAGANHWLALDALAASAQQFAKKYKHNVAKKALGLPRRVGAPTTGRFVPGAHVKDRHAAPVLYHFDRAADGKLVARAVAFPACELPNLTDSRKLLGELLDHLRNDLPGRFATHVKGTPPPGAPRGAPPATAGPQLKQGTRVKAKVVADPKGKNRPFAEALGKVGVIESVPANRTLAVGEEVELFVKSVSADGKQVTYRWL